MRYDVVTLIITGDSLQPRAGILMRCNGLLVGAFNENSPVVADHQVSLDDDIDRFGTCVYADRGDLMLIGLDDVVSDDVVRSWCVELIAAGLIDCDVGIPDLMPLLTIRLATVERKDVSGDDAAERVGNPKSLAATAGNGVAVECTELAAAFDGYATGAVVADDVVGRDNVVATFEKVAAHLRPGNEVVVELTLPTEEKMRAVRAGVLQSASTHRKVMYVVHSYKALVLTLRSLLRTAIRLGLVVTVVVAAVVDNRVEDSDVGGGMLGVHGKDADPVA